MIDEILSPDSGPAAHPVNLPPFFGPPLPYHGPVGWPVFSGMKTGCHLTKCGPLRPQPLKLTLRKEFDRLKESSDGGMDDGNGSDIDVVGGGDED